MLKFYYCGAPNPTKVALMLEETGLPYEPIAVDTRKGDQHKPEFLAINPNAKVPAIVDGDATVFDSSAILLYLGEKTGKFMPAKTDKARGELLSGCSSWRPASARIRASRCISASTRRRRSTTRSTATPSRRSAISASSTTRLAKNKYMLGDTYTIVDMNIWGWARLIPNVLGENGWAKFPNLKRMIDEISARPAAAKAVALKDKHKFKTEMDDEAKNAMFPHLTVKVA